MKKIKVRGSKVIDLSDTLECYLTNDAFFERIIGLRFEYKSEIFVVPKSMLNPRFFEKECVELRDLMQLCINYNIILVIVGNFEFLDDELLSDFIYTCNNGKHMFLVEEKNHGIALLKGII